MNAHEIGATSDLIVARAGDDRDQPCNVLFPDDPGRVADPDVVKDDAVPLEEVCPARSVKRRSRRGAARP